MRVGSVHGGNVVAAGREPARNPLSWCSMMIRKRDCVHVGNIKGVPIEVKSLDVVDGVLEEGMTGSNGHEGIV